MSEQDRKANEDREARRPITNEDEGDREAPDVELHARRPVSATDEPAGDEGGDDFEAHAKRPV